MQPQDFKAWRKRHFRSQADAAEALGISRASVDLYERGQRRDDARPVEIPKAVELACAAIEIGVRAYGGEKFAHGGWKVYSDDPGFKRVLLEPFKAENRDAAERHVERNYRGELVVFCPANADPYGEG